MSDDEPKPDHIKDNISFKLFESPDGTKTYLTGLGLPMEGAMQLFGTMAYPLHGSEYEAAKPIGSQLNPQLKYLGEAFTGVSMFMDGGSGHGRPLSELDPTVGRIMSNVRDLATGERTKDPAPFVNQGFEHMMLATPFSRMLTTARALTDPRKYQSVQTVLAQTANQLTGLKFYDVSPESQDAILKQRLGEIAKAMGIREFRGHYKPDYLKLTEEEKAVWDAIQKEFDNMTKRRLERKEVATP
jgi:hypothetical protein